MDLNLKLDEAIRACCLSETLTRQRLHYFVKKERARLENTTPHTQRECQNGMGAMVAESIVGGAKRTCSCR